MSDYAVYEIPSGPKNLNILFAGLDWNKISDYYIDIYDADGNKIASTPAFSLGCCCGDDKIRIIFYNYDGSWDGINFMRPDISHDTVSSSYQKGLKYPLEKIDTGEERFNVNANDTYTAITYCYKETDREWLQECLDSGKAFMQKDNMEGEDSYLPIVILDSKFAAQSKDSYNYVLTIQFKLSNGYIIQRN